MQLHRGGFMSQIEKEIKMKEKYFYELAIQYKDRFEILDKEITPQCCRIELATGGYVEHRGYYCPSLIVDIVISNSNRGRLIKRPRKEPKVSYKYYFDNLDRLRCVEAFDYKEIERQNSKEFLIYDGNKCVSVMYNTMGVRCEMEVMTECSYDDKGRIIEYDFASFPQNPQLFEFWMEKYQYNELGLYYVHKYHYMSFMTLMDKIVANKRYYFTHDEQGFLKSYTIQEYKGDDPIETDPHVYEVKKTIKRKV
jgi:hypothetical protein